MNRRAIILAVLIATTMFSALAVITVKHMSRELQHELQVLRVRHDQLKVKWAQLKLEESTWAGHDRVRKLARTRLDMYLPKHYKVLEPQP